MKSFFLSLSFSRFDEETDDACAGMMVYYYCAARNLKKSAFDEEKKKRRCKKPKKNKSNEGRRRRRRKTISWSRHKKTVVYPVLRRRNRGNATLISWSLFLRVLQGRATICQPPRPGGTLGFIIIIIILSRFCAVLFLLPSRFSGKNSVF